MQPQTFDEHVKNSIKYRMKAHLKIFILMEYFSRIQQHFVWSLEKKLQSARKFLHSQCIFMKFIKIPSLYGNIDLVVLSIKLA